MITLIAARARNHAIGKGNDIPWHVPEDLNLFKQETLGGAIIMGRRTWESLPFKPLKNRLNVVVSRDKSLADHVCSSIEEAVKTCYDQGYNRVYGIGGETIYRDLLPIADRLMLTEVDLSIDDADAFFPEFDEANWQEVATATVRTENPACQLRELLRKR